MGSGVTVLNEHATPEITSATVWFLGALVSLAGPAGLIYWFAKTYATEKFVCKQTEYLWAKLNALSDRLDRVTEDVAEGREVSASVRTELQFIRAGLDGLNGNLYALSGRIDRVLDGRQHQPLILGEDNKR